MLWYGGYNLFRFNSGFQARLRSASFLHQGWCISSVIRRTFRLIEYAL
jgi:hypothetical protein